MVIPEALVGHERYLFGIRREASDAVAKLSAHAVRLRWSDAYLSKPSLTQRRCELAHGALVTAYQALATAAKEYERGLTMALVRCGDGPTARSKTLPVRLLDEAAAVELARLRDVCESALLNVREACCLQSVARALLEVRWPVRRSEVGKSGLHLYGTEPRPIGWEGFGQQPLLHVDAK